MPVSEQTYRRVAMEDDETWELRGGRLRVKPGATAEHSDVTTMLGFSLMDRLDRADYHVRINGGRVRCSVEDSYVPDVFVIPDALTRPVRGKPDVLEACDDPLPLVVEVWEPPTAVYDAAGKGREYQRHGDAEIWLLHPYERTLRAWRRQPDGSYRGAVYDGGSVRPVALPGVELDVDAIFEG